MPRKVPRSRDHRRATSTRASSLRYDAGCSGCEDRGRTRPRVEGRARGDEAIAWTDRAMGTGDWVSAGRSRARWPDAVRPCVPHRGRDPWPVHSSTCARPDPASSSTAGRSLAGSWRRRAAPSGPRVRAADRDRSCGGRRAGRWGADLPERDACAGHRRADGVGSSGQRARGRRAGRVEDGPCVRAGQHRDRLDGEDVCGERRGSRRPSIASNAGYRGRIAYWSVRSAGRIEQRIQILDLPDAYSKRGHRETQARARLYHFGVVTTPPSKSSDRDGAPKKGEPQRDPPTGDERPVDDKTPVTRRG
jgi:hypothetical protein